VSLRDHWDAQAAEWIRFVRTPGHDNANERLNIPRFLELLPTPGRATLDLGCGEGRLGVLLGSLGHAVTGIDTSAAMVAAARERHEAIVADAAALPFADASFDLVTAFMSLHDMDDPAGAVSETARVLSSGGRFCIALEHPFSLAGHFESREPDAPFVIEGSYLQRRRIEGLVERGGISVTFAKQTGPLQWYAEMLESAGLLIETIREPVPDDDHVAFVPSMARRRRVPLFLHLRVVKP
jgi:SAM-dependent methyltransferase